MGLNYGPPIYQAYLDAVQGQIKQQESKLEMGLHAVELQQGIINIQNQMQERKAIAQAYQQMDQGTQGNQGTQGQQGTGANPATGGPNLDPAEKTAQVYDRIASSVGRFNPKLALEYSTKASTLRDQALTRQKTNLDVSAKQTEIIGNIFGSVDPTDQEGYTAALSKAADMGVDISKFGLTGNVVQDAPKLKQIAQSTMTYKDKLNTQHQKVTEDQANLNYTEKVRYDSGRLSLQSAGLNLSSQRLELDKQFKTDELNYRARADARAQAGVARTDSMDLAKSKDFAGRPGKGDVSYAQAVIAADPDLSMLPDDAKKNVTQQLVMGARAALSKSVKKPGDAVTADDFTREVNKLLPMIKKQVEPGSAGHVFGMIGAKDASLKAPLPAAIDTKAQFDGLKIGDQFRKDDKMYKKTGPNQYEEVK